jgi:hypothetical protein
MTQTGLAVGGAAGLEARTHVVWLGVCGGGWKRKALAATIVVALAGGIAWFGWRSSVPASHLAGGANVVAITGDVLVEGGPVTEVGENRLDLHTMRSVPVLVTGTTGSGRRVVRRFSADRQGHFNLRLPPGRYTFTAVLYQGGIPLTQEPHATVHIRPGQQQPRIRIVEPVI